MAQTNFLTLKVNLRQNLNQNNLAAYQKYYAEVDSEKTLTTLGLAKHLKEHWRYDWRQHRWFDRW